MNPVSSPIAPARLHAYGGVRRDKCSLSFIIILLMSVNLDRGVLGKMP